MRRFHILCYLHINVVPSLKAVVTGCHRFSHFLSGMPWFWEWSINGHIEKNRVSLGIKYFPIVFHHVFSNKRGRTEFNVMNIV